MKNSDSSKQVHAIPDGVWEASKPKNEKQDIKTDLQGNGYPASNKQSK